MLKILKILKQFKIMIILFIVILCFDSLSLARRRHTDYQNQDSRRNPSSNAEEGDDAYDPFADYSEFEYENDEEADVNFFRNGRMLNIGFLTGLNMFTGNLGQKAQNGLKYGLYISYFFDMRFAIQFSYTTGDFPVAFSSPLRTITGVGTFNSLGFNTKYYFNTQNVTRGFAKLNPYLILGFSNQYKTIAFSGIPGNTKQAAMGFDIGVGIEIPIMRKKMYWGAQAAYHHVNFKDSFTDFVYDGDNYGNQTGDQIDILGLIGINF